MTAPEVIDSYFPFVLNLLGTRLAETDLARFFEKQEALLARGERYVTITDTSPLREIPGATVRRDLAEWSKRLEPQMRRFAIGTAVVVASPLVRGGLTALQWLAPPPYPSEVVATRLEGLDRMLDLCQRLNEPAHAAVLRYREDYVAGRARAAM